MSYYAVIPSTLSTSPAFIQSEPLARYLTLTLYSAPERRFGGLFSITTRRISQYMGLTEDEVERGLILTSAADLVHYTSEWEVAWLPGATQHDLKNTGTTHIKGLARSISAIPPTPLRDQCLGMIRELLPAEKLDLFEKVSDFQSIGKATPHKWVTDTLFNSPTDTQNDRVPDTLCGTLSDTLSGHRKGNMNREVKENRKQSVENCDLWENRAIEAETYGKPLVRAPESLPRTMAAIEIWDRVLVGTRHQLTPAAREICSRLAIPKRITDQAEEICRIVRASEGLRDKLNIGFKWVFTPKNADRVLGGDFPSDAKGSSSPAKRQTGVVDLGPDMTPEEQLKSNVILRAGKLRLRNPNAPESELMAQAEQQIESESNGK